LGLARLLKKEVLVRIIEAALTSLSTSQKTLLRVRADRRHRHQDQAMPLTVMIAVQVTAGMPFFITVSTAL
jgi:hypothetical protein